MLTEMDIRAIQKAVTGVGEAWNANDMKAYASYLTEDCDCTHPSAFFIGTR